MTDLQSQLNQLRNSLNSGPQAPFVPETNVYHRTPGVGPTTAVPVPTFPSQLPPPPKSGGWFLKKYGIYIVLVLLAGVGIIFLTRRKLKANRLTQQKAVQGPSNAFIPGGGQFGGAMGRTAPHFHRQGPDPGYGTPAGLGQGAGGRRTEAATAAAAADVHNVDPNFTPL